VREYPQVGVRGLATTACRVDHGIVLQNRFSWRKSGFRKLRLDEKHRYKHRGDAVNPVERRFGAAGRTRTDNGENPSGF
jgi:hypothetical protein